MDDDFHTAARVSAVQMVVEDLVGIIHRIDPAAVGTARLAAEEQATRARQAVGTASAPSERLAQALQIVERIYDRAIPTG